MNDPALPILRLDERTYGRGLACVHCGMCLPACPTYVETGNESDSPRGRIQLMLGLSDGRIAASEAVLRHLDLCLDCRACETACPSEVVYHELIEQTRQRLPSRPRLRLRARALLWLALNVLTRPTAAKILLMPAKLLRRIGGERFAPRGVAKLLGMLPKQGRLWPARLPEMSPIVSNPKARVGFLSGCVAGVVDDELNRRTLDVLCACGADVRVPRLQVCCGAIHHHNGAHEQAASLARRNIDAFAECGADFIVTNVAGCGAMLREYDQLLRDDPAYAARAKEFSSRVRDVCAMVAHLGLPPMKHPIDQSITYHDACHLVHAQRVSVEPRELLARVPGLRIIPLPESDMCCGAAGTYNLTQPEMSERLADRKLENIALTGATACVTGNVGCAMQIRAHAARRGLRLHVVHPVALIHRSLFGGEKMGD
ncbi:MAG: (Fe-S)-binding protein [Tepidisphaeraceae bacterium]